MKILQGVQKSFKSLGLSPKPDRFNRKIFIFSIIYFPVVVSLWIFLVHEANSAEEYLESIYVVTTCSGILISFASTILAKMRLFSFIKKADVNVNESKNRKIEF